MRGFTLVELMVAVSIIAVLSTVGVTAFSKAQVKARDTTRKNDLRQIQTALDLYYEAEHRYPGGNGSGEATADCYAVNGTTGLVANIGSYLSSAPKDPKTQIPYCYKADPQGSYFVLWTKLENCDEANENIDRCKNGEDVYNYAISSNEAFLAQKSTVPAFIPQTIRTPSITAPTPINRITQSACQIWINGTWDSYQQNFERSTYRVVQGSSIAIKGLLPGRFRMKVAGPGPVLEVSGVNGFTVSDKYIEQTPDRVDGPFTIYIESITNPDIKCHRNYTTVAPSCSGTKRGSASITIRMIRDNNFEPDQWPIYNPKNICTAANLPAVAFNKFTAFTGQMMSSVKDSFTSAQQQPAVLGTANDDFCTGGAPNATACGYEDPPRSLGYCFSGVCRFDTCGSNSDCADNNTCTTSEACGGFATSPNDNKSRGLCAKEQVPANTVCAPSLNAPATSATMLCSGGINSQCNVPYVQCTKASDNTANCCGTTNIQIPDSCRACAIDARRTRDILASKSPYINDIAVWITDNCQKQYTVITGEFGVAQFNNMAGRHNYPVGFEVPNGMLFTRAYSIFFNQFNEVNEFYCYGGSCMFSSQILAPLRTVQSSDVIRTFDIGIGLN